MLVKGHISYPVVDLSVSTMTLRYSKKLALAATAAAAIVGNVSAFAVLPNVALQRAAVPTCSPSICLPAQQERHGEILALRSSSNDESGKVDKMPSMGIEIDSDTVRMDPGGYDVLDIKGEYTDDGWIDESEISSEPGLFGKLFNGFFGSNEPSTEMSREELDAELDVITYLDGTQGSLVGAVRSGSAVPFGGLNPKQVDAYRTATLTRDTTEKPLIPDRYIQYPDEKPLPAGWFEAVDETSGARYYYNAAGETTWERPVPAAK